MKVGVLSMQKILNYGSFLQAFSLKTQLERRGCDVYFIDILAGKTICEVSKSTNTSVSLAKKFDRYTLRRIENYFLSRKMTRIHIDDYRRFLQTDKTLKPGERFDLAVIGSDEVFNATIPSRWGFSTQLFGKIDEADRVVTYAASCGSTTLAAAEKFGIVDELRDAMTNLRALSVRDRNTADFVAGILGREPEIHVDPVFLTDFDAHIPTVKTRRPYLLVYAYGNRISDEREIAAVREYAKKRNLEILCVGMQQRWADRTIAANAFELLAYVKGAERVVTDTFHGSVFSIKYNKKFATFIRESNRNKLGGLLRQFGLFERSVENMVDLERVLDADVDYVATNAAIAAEQKRSFDYLDAVCRLG
ncbi:MAG: polysaccharide pyruvyl transferase family protein [Thermoguttaceae bacterium]|nr:polysaccharide pyruvyl transferase family protein [Thermoguttaceae bacterium]MBQ9126789.1 polysaccharide pyruvyl transferase family protein [Thermoguttaceae bacterium]